MGIPPDLRDFLAGPDNLGMTLEDGEIRRLSFFSPDELKPTKFIVDSYGLHLDGLLATDPKVQIEFEGFSLIRECNDYSPDGVLAWFPELNAYGSADTDHGRIIIYPGVTWSDIVREPTWFINGQWYPDRVSHREVNPWT